MLVYHSGILPEQDNDPLKANFEKQIPLIYQCFHDKLCYFYIGVVSKINFNEEVINKFLKNVILLNFVNYINFQILLLFLTNPTRFLIPSSS